MRAETKAAEALGGRRVARERFESAPDVADVPGWVPEVKYRKRLPRLVVDALRQAGAYAIFDQRPLVVLFERGSREGIAVLRLADFAELIGVRAQVEPPAPGAGASPATTPARTHGVRGGGSR